MSRAYDDRPTEDSDNENDFDDLDDPSNGDNGDSSAPSNSSKSSALAAPPKRPEILTERTVIHEALIRNAIHREMKYYFDPNRVPAEEKIDFSSISTLVLSFRGIYSIENLDSFQHLTKLQLDNNQIEEINGLSSLVALQWLDLSYNKIKRIENLDHLKQLTDLSLQNNQIEQIENLQPLIEKLTVLSLGNNKIYDLSAIRSLRGFHALRLLNLKGNPVSFLEDYQNTCFAYLTGLKYLDYVIIEPGQFARARDSKLDILLLLEAKEKQEENEKKILQQKDLEEKKRIDANLGGISSFFNDLIASDSEQPKIRLLPGYSQLFSQYEYYFNELLNEFSNDFLGKFQWKQQEFQGFLTASKELYEESEKQSRKIIHRYEKEKLKKFQFFSSFSPEEFEASANSPASQALQALKNLLAQSADELMECEMLLVERMANFLEEFDRSYMKLVGENLIRISLCFRSLLDLSNKHLNSLYELSHSLLDRFAREDPLIMEEMEIRALLSDKDILNNTISTGHENQDGKILAMEDLLREREENSGKSLIKEMRKKEYLRNRKRVAEIYDFRAREEAAMEENIPQQEDS